MNCRENLGNLHSAEIQLRGCGGGELEQAIRGKKNSSHGTALVHVDELSEGYCAKPVLLWPVLADVFGMDHGWARCCPLGNVERIGHRPES